MDKLLEAIAAESLLVWLLTLVMVHKEHDVILYSVLESEIYGVILLYFISFLDIDWNTVAVACGVFTQHVRLTSVSTDSSNGVLLPMNGDGFSLFSEC